MKANSLLVKLAVALPPTHPLPIRPRRNSRMSAKNACEIAGIVVADSQGDAGDVVVVFFQGGAGGFDAQAGEVVVHGHAGGGFEAFAEPVGGQADGVGEFGDGKRLAEFAVQNGQGIGDGIIVAAVLVGGQAAVGGRGAADDDQQFG